MVLTLRGLFISIAQVRSTCHKRLADVRETNEIWDRMQNQLSQQLQREKWGPHLLSRSPGACTSGGAPVCRACTCEPLDRFNANGMVRIHIGAL